MSDSRTPELEVVIKCTSDLESALQQLDKDLVHFMREKGFILDATHDEILKPQTMLTDVQRAGELVKCIRNRVEQDSSSFHTLLCYFKQGGAFYEPVVRKLTAGYPITCSATGLQETNPLLFPPSSSSLPSDNEQKDEGEFG
jgi:hypothetical protein